MASRLAQSLKLFVRPSLTNNVKEQALLAASLKQLQNSASRFVRRPVEFLTPIEHDIIMKSSFDKIGVPFSAKRFREFRLQTLSQADGMIVLRTAPLDADASFELAYNNLVVRLPTLFVSQKSMQMREETMLKELDDVKYRSFETDDELAPIFDEYLHSLADKQQEFVALSMDRRFMGITI